jgi:lipopolysaccharide assembly protein A
VANNPTPTDAQDGQDPFVGERQTRLSGIWTGLVVSILALVLVLVFILQNLQGAEVYFLVFHGRLPLAVALLFAMVLGAVIVVSFGVGRIVQLRLVARRARHQGRGKSPPERADSPNPDR